MGEIELCLHLLRHLAVGNGVLELTLLLRAPHRLSALKNLELLNFARERVDASTNRECLEREG